MHMDKGFAWARIPTQIHLDPNMSTNVNRTYTYNSYTCLYAHAHIYVYICMYVYIYICRDVSVGIFVHTYVSRYFMYVYIYVFENLRALCRSSMPGQFLGSPVRVPLDPMVPLSWAAPSL